MRGRVRELVLLPIALVQGDEDTEVMFAGRDLNRCPCELCRELVKASCAEAFGGALDVEG